VIKKELIADINHFESMSETIISDIQILKDKEVYALNEKITFNVKFSITGVLRESFTEENWTKLYEKYDNVFKLKYGIKLNKSGLRKNSINQIDSYKKASIFWTRNPKLVNPMKEKRIWVQVAKNFKPVIRLTEEEVREEFFDFDEKILVEAKDLGVGKHQVNAEAYASWQKHDFIEKDEAKSQGKEIEIIIN